MWDQTRVPELYARLLERHPDHPFASWWAYVLAERFTGETQARYSQLFEDLTHKQLLRTEQLRPGFVARPAVTDAAAVRQRGESTEIRLNGEEPTFIGPAEVYGSDRVGLMVYVGVTSGVVLADLELETDDGVIRSGQQYLNVGDVGKYRMLKWNGSAPVRKMRLRLRQYSDSPAVVRVRDFYPLIENPHVASID
jgi:hypothetical protein